MVQSRSIRHCIAAATAFLVIITLASPMATAVSQTVLVPPHSDTGIDTDGDTLYNSLRVSVNLNVTTAGVVDTIVQLRDSTDSIDITGGDALFVLSVGPVVISVDLKGPEIRDSGIDGPYLARILVYDGFSYDDSGVHVTNAYRATDFDPNAAAFGAPHSDEGIDMDGDGLFDVLRVHAVVNVVEAGFFSISGRLLDQSSVPFDYGGTNSFLFPGAGQIVDLDFPGRLIRAHGVAGPYAVELYLGDAFLYIPLDQSTHTTAPYAADQFNAGPARFAPPHSDTAIDVDGDGLYDVLRVQIRINASVAGRRTVRVDLYDQFSGYIDTFSFAFDVPVGTGQAFDVDIPGWVFRARGVDGPYTAALQLYDAISRELLDEGSHTTAAYGANEFMVPAAALAPPHEDRGVDTDGDGLFNAIETKVSIQVNEAAEYEIVVQFYDETSFIYLGQNFIDLALDQGLQVVPMSKTTVNMKVEQLDGPYLVDISLYVLVGNEYLLLGKETYVTQPYEWVQFDAIPVTFSPPHNDSGEDLDVPPDGLWNVLRVDVSLDVGEAGSYYVSAALWDSGKTSAIAGDARVFFLQPGAQTVPMFFSGVAIRRSGIDGPYLVEIELLLVPLTFYYYITDTYVTGAYASSDFQDVAPATIFGTVRDSTASNGIPFADVLAVDYRNAYAIRTSADVTGAYTLGAYKGDWVVWHDATTHNAELMSATVTGPTQLDAALDLSTPDSSILNMTLGAWDTLEIQLSTSVAVDVAILRATIDSGMGNRDQVLDRAEWDLFLRATEASPSPLDSTRDIFLTDSYWYNLVAGSHSYETFDAEGPIGSTVPIRIEEREVLRNSNIPGAFEHTIEFNVPYDRGVNVSSNVLLPSGFVLTSYVAPSEIQVGGVGARAIPIDPGADPNPMDLIVSAWIVLFVTAPDTTSPLVSSPSASPDPVVIGNPVAITAEAVDDRGIVEVRLEAWNPEGDLAVNASMAPTGGSSYELGFFPAAAGQWSYSMTAIDGAGNTGSAQGTFVVEDRSAPRISEFGATPVPQEYGLPVLFAAHIGDDSAVATVTVEVRNPSGAPLGNFTMTFNETSGSYERAARILEVGTNSFRVWATDTHGNVASSSGTFEIVDTTAPVLFALQVSPSPAEVGGSARILLTVTDLAGVQSVQVEITNPTGAAVGTFSMTAAGGDVYQYDFTPNEVGIYAFVVVASDTHGNTAAASANVLVRDAASPTASAGSDRTLEVGSLGTFDGSGSADNVGVVNYTWSFTAGGRSFTKYGATASHTFTVVETVVITLTVRDAAGNTGTDTLTIRVQDTTPPRAGAGPDRTVDAGTRVEFNGSASRDNVGVANYTWTFADGGSTITLYGVSPVYTFDSEGTYVVTLTVRDAGGNTHGDTVKITVRAPSAPVPGIPSWPWIAASVVIGIIALLLLRRRRERRMLELRRVREQEDPR